MKVDILVVENGWWPVAWGIRFIDNKRVLVIRESPFNPHARGERKKLRVEGIWIPLYQNQTVAIWTIRELQAFMETLEEDAEVEISEEVDLPLPIPASVKWWTTSYTIYM